jgi:hypothetical protein
MMWLTAVKMSNNVQMRDVTILNAFARVKRSHGMFVKWRNGGNLYRDVGVGHAS